MKALRYHRLWDMDFSMDDVFTHLKNHYHLRAKRHASINVSARVDGKRIKFMADIPFGPHEKKIFVNEYRQTYTEYKNYYRLDWNYLSIWTHVKNELFLNYYLLIY